MTNQIQMRKCPNRQTSDRSNVKHLKLGKNQTRNETEATSNETSWIKVVVLGFDIHLAFELYHLTFNLDANRVEPLPGGRSKPRALGVDSLLMLLWRFGGLLRRRPILMQMKFWKEWLMNLQDLLPLNCLHLDSFPFYNAYIRVDLRLLERESCPPSRRDIPAAYDWRSCT